MQPNPVRPINTSPLNPYVGIDRGLFFTRRVDYPFARVKSASWVCLGPTPSPGHLTFTLVGYTKQPTTPAEFEAGVPIPNAVGGLEYDCMTRGPVYEPILVEYYATEIYLNHYLTGGESVTPEELSNGEGIAKRFVASMGGAFGVTSVLMEVGFSSHGGGLPISRDSMRLTYEGVVAGSPVSHSTILSGDPADPVLSAIDHIKTQ